MRQAGGVVRDEVEDDPHALVAAAVEHMDAGDRALAGDDRDGARRHYGEANGLILDIDPEETRAGRRVGAGVGARVFAGLARLKRCWTRISTRSACDADRAVDRLRLFEAGPGGVAAPLATAGRAYAGASRWSEAAERLTEAVQS